MYPPAVTRWIPDYIFMAYFPSKTMRSMKDDIRFDAISDEIHE